MTKDFADQGAHGLVCRVRVSSGRTHCDVYLIIDRSARRRRWSPLAIEREGQGTRGGVPCALKKGPVDGTSRRAACVDERSRSGDWVCLWEEGDVLECGWVDHGDASLSRGDHRHLREPLTQGNEKSEVSR